MQARFATKTLRRYATRRQLSSGAQFEYEMWLHLLVLYLRVFERLARIARSFSQRKEGILQGRQKWIDS